jgi:(p)ppGpp synthase/HD superfamily hydrolase
LLSTHIPQIKRFKNVFKVIEMIVIIHNIPGVFEKLMQHIKKYPLYCLSVECMEKIETHQKISLKFEVYDMGKITILKNDLLQIEGVKSINF